MLVSRAVSAVGGLLVVVSACGSSTAKPADAGDCWPLKSTPGGQAQMGTGDITFEPMPAVLPIIMNGSQSDPYIEVHSRITGMPPGNPNDALDPKNPKTKVGGVIMDLGKTLGVMCPASLGYVASPVQDSYDMTHSLRLGFGTLSDAQAAVGKQVMITLEVVGSNGLYAEDQMTVTLGGGTTGADGGLDAM